MPVQSLTGEDIESYSVNLMWINSSKNSGSTIASNRGTSRFNDVVIQPAVKWAKANPQAQVVLWYDSVHTTEEAVANSKKILEEHKMSNIQLRDVREIPCVKNNPDIFTSEVPIYFRVDLLKLIILLHSIDHDHCDAAVFSDLEVGDQRPNKDRMSKQELFSEHVCKGFSKMGFVVGDKRIFEKIGEGGIAGQENQFLQVYKNPLVLDAIRLNINSNFARVMQCLTHTEQSEREKIGKLNKIVYETMFKEIGEFFNAMQIGAKIRWPQEIEPFKGVGSAEYYMEGKSKPVTIPYSFIPQRNMYQEVRQPCVNSALILLNSESIYKNPAPPCNGKNYCCAYLPYQTDEARAVLRLHERRFEVSKSGMFGNSKPVVTSHELDKLIGQLNDYKAAISKKEDPISINKYLGAIELHLRLTQYKNGALSAEELGKYVNNEMDIPTYSKMFTGDSASDDLKKYFEYASRLVIDALTPKM